MSDNKIATATDLKKFIVNVREKPRDERSVMRFECLASDFDHAKEQATIAYPAGFVASIYRV